MEKTEIILRDNGTLTERTIRERDLKAEGEVLDELTADVTRRQRNVMAVSGWGHVHADVGLNDTVWSVPIKHIPLKARFRVINGVLVPMFASLTDLEMPMVWSAPKEVRLVFVVRTETVEDGVEIGGNWIFFCTVNHHCSTSAFQSGTDEENERNQDGLHLTVGRMDAERHDLHARFYLNGNCFAPDLSRFWPLAPALTEQLPAAVWDEVARFQMGEKVVVDFPDAWRKNVQEVHTHSHHTVGHYPGNLELTQSAEDWPGSPALDLPVWLRIERTVREISQKCLDYGFSKEDFVALLQELAENPAASLVVEGCLKHQVTPDELLGEIQPVELGF